MNIVTGNQRVSKFVLGIDVGFENTGLSLMHSITGGLLKILYLENIKSPRLSKEQRKEVYLSDEIVLRVQNTISRLKQIIFEKIIQPYDKSPCNCFKNRAITKTPVLCCLEMPTGASISAEATRGMGVAIGAIVSFLSFQKNWSWIMVRPNEGKMAAHLSLKPTKQEMIAAIQNLNLRDGISWPQNNIWPKNLGDQEHVADSIAAVLAAKEFHSETFHKYFINS